MKESKRAIVQIKNLKVNYSDIKQKIVHKAGSTASGIYLPKSWAGSKVLVIKVEEYIDYE